MNASSLTHSIVDVLVDYQIDLAQRIERGPKQSDIRDLAARISAWTPNTEDLRGYFYAVILQSSAKEMASGAPAGVYQLAKEIQETLQGLRLYLFPPKKGAVPNCLTADYKSAKKGWNVPALNSLLKQSKLPPNNLDDLIAHSMRQRTFLDIANALLTYQYDSLSKDAKEKIRLWLDRKSRGEWEGIFFESESNESQISWRQLNEETNYDDILLI